MEKTLSADFGPQYRCWLNYAIYRQNADRSLEACCHVIVAEEKSRLLATAAEELRRAIREIYSVVPQICAESAGPCIRLSVRAAADGTEPAACAYRIEPHGDRLEIIGTDDHAVLYGAFRLIEEIGLGRPFSRLAVAGETRNQLRIVEHWDNLSGDIERGYAGKSIFYRDGKITQDLARICEYARLLASVGINSLSINNVNVFTEETRFLTDAYLPQIAKIASVFSDYGIRIFLSVNFAAPMQLGALPTADPLDPAVAAWWRRTVDHVYSRIPDFGGFLVKADSESRPGPYTYGRDHAQGANMLADALAPHGGLLIWRCFVYNCHMDWRDRKLDRARAAYDTFMPLDGRFRENVVLQIKNGPMDFQIREPVTPLFGGLAHTNQVMELQITQEYTGQQIDLCFLVPLWKEALDFDTYAKGKGSPVRDIVSGRLFGSRLGGIAGVSNIGDSPAWTGHPLAQANLFGFGRLTWEPDRSGRAIAEEWTKLTFGGDRKVMETVPDMLMRSREIYERYTSPLGIGWFVNPGFHYGPSVDGYEYSRWGTYHYADIHGIGVDRTAAAGTGYAAQYRPPNAQMYERPETCPENLLLFFHHVRYDYRLSSGLTLLQYIYDTHFRGVEQVRNLQREWESLQGRVDGAIYEEVSRRLKRQMENAVEWRDVVNTYFYRKTGIPDAQGRPIYP